MRFHLDTHVFLWMDSDPSRLSQRVKESLLAPDCMLHISMASAWEMAIKSSLGKLELAVPLDQMLGAYSREKGMKILPITLPHLVDLMSLPHHHRDPFDRLIISQARVEELTIISADQAFDAYQATRYWE